MSLDEEVRSLRIYWLQPTAATPLVRSGASGAWEAGPGPASPAQAAATQQLGPQAAGLSLYLHLSVGTHAHTSLLQHRYCIPHRDALRRGSQAPRAQAGRAHAARRGARASPTLGPDSQHHVAGCVLQHIVGHCRGRGEGRKGGHKEAPCHVGRCVPGLGWRGPTAGRQSPTPLQWGAAHRTPPPASSSAPFG